MKLVNGIEVEESSEDLEQAAIDAAYIPPVTSEMINQERDRRAELNFIFNGKEYQAKKSDIINILGAVSNAQSALLSGGGSSGDLRWRGGDTDFSWISADNSTVAMDALTVLAFGAAAATHKEKTILRARALKDMVDEEGNPAIPTDALTNNTYWD